MGCFNSTSNKGAKKTNDNNEMQADFSKNMHNGVTQLKQNYKIDNNPQVLGAGSFGKVFLSQNINDPNFKVAIKVLNKQKLKENIASIKEEVRILTKLDHPNIVKYYETYDDVKYMYLVMEYCSGGELFDKIAAQKDQMFQEGEAAKIMKKLLRAISHCHASGVVHRDIKPENVMYGRDGEIKLIDFGLSKSVKSKAQQLTTIAGTPYYMAPEVIDGEYNSQCDIWSLGVLMYVLLSGYLPFQGDNRNIVFNKIQKAKYHFDHKEFKTVSDEGKSLIKKMLVLDHNARITAQQALKDPWFGKYKHMDKNDQEQKLDPNLVSKLREFRGVSTLKKVALNILVKMTSDSTEVEKIRSQFQKIDTLMTGFITANELKAALNEAGIKYQEGELDKIINEVDFHGNNQINYTEFLAATISVKKILTKEHLVAMFNQFDTDGSGSITINDIREAMNKFGQKITNEEIEDIMQKHAVANPNQISYDEFKKIFEGLQ